MRILTLIVLLALATFPAHAAPANKDAPAIGAVLREQAAAWNRGDLPGFMLAYANVPDLTYTASGVLVTGYDALERRYKERYGNSRETMGKLYFDNIAVSSLGPGYALTIGRWYLDRDGQPRIDGIFSLIWHRTEDGWKIIHDHSSLRPEK